MLSISVILVTADCLTKFFSDDSKKLFFTILLITTLRFFSNIRFSFIVPYLEVSPGIKLCSDAIDDVALYWMLALFFGLIGGAYTLGKYGENNGILLLCKIIIIGTVLPCLLLYFLGSQSNHIINNNAAILGIRFINAFFHPAAFVVSAIFLMKVNNDAISVKISAYTILAAITGMQLSYFVVTYFAKNNLNLWCQLFLASSILAASICILCKKTVEEQIKKITTPESHITANPLAIALAILIGCIFNAGLRYHYFFVDTYVSDILIAEHDPALGYLFFYIALSIFLLFAGHLLKQHNQIKILTFSLIGILLVGISPIILPIHSLVNYIAYQIIFAFFVAGFLAPSLSVIFTLFKNNQTIFHSTMWFTVGYALSNSISDWLTSQYGFFTHFNFLPMIPLIFGGFCCLTVLTSTNVNRLIPPNKS